MRALGFGLGVSFGSVVFPTLTISPSSSTVGASGVGETFTASGGTGTGYTYTMHTNASGGSVNSSTGVYSPGATPGTDVVRVTDSLGHTADGTITVNAALAISPSSKNLMVTDGGGQNTQTFTATGGSGSGYVFSIVGGALHSETLNSGTGAYVAVVDGDWIPFARTIRVTDSLGNTSDAAVTVYPRIAIVAATGGVNWTGDGVSAVASHTFTATGGSASGYTWGVTTATNSTINSGTGVYQAGDAASTSDTITLTDSLGFTASHVSQIGVFRPEDLPSCVVAYDARFGVTNTGGKASAWVDQTGSDPTNKNLVQATSGARPSINTIDAAYAGQITLSLAGAQWLEGAGDWASPVAQPITWYVVGEIASGRILDGDSGGDGKRNAFLPNTGIPDIFAGNFVASSGGAANTPQVMCGIFNGASSSVYINNHTTGGTGDAGSGGIDHQVIGAAQGGTAPGSGKIAMAFAYSGAHSTAQRLRIFTQLSNIYGIPIT